MSVCVRQGRARFLIRKPLFWVSAAAAVWAFSSVVAAAGPQVRLGEVMSADNAAFADEDGSFEDWIEVVNLGDAPAQLEGWGLTDDPSNSPLKWTFPALTLKTNEHLLVWASGKDRRPPGKVSDGTFVVVPSNSVWRYRDSGLAPDAGWYGTNYSDGAWAAGPAMLGYGAIQATTISYGPDANNKYQAAYFRHTFFTPVKPGDVLTNGVLRLWVDDGAIVYLNGREILRVRMPAGAVTHTTYASALASGRGLWETFTVPVDALRQGTNVLAVEVHQYNASSSDLVLWAELSLRPRGQHTNFKISAGNETVTLSDPSGAPVDVAPALSVPRDASFGRAAGDADGPWLMFSLPTPGAPNGAGYIGLLEPPVFSVAPGFYAGPVTVALTHADPAAEIYYTLDGSTPTNTVTASCFRYTVPLVLTNRNGEANGVSLIRTNPPEMAANSYGWVAPQGLVPKVNVVRATAFKPGFHSPRSAAGAWLVGGAPLLHTLKVISLQSDYADLFGDPRGLFVPGDIYNTLGWNGHAVGLPNANYFQRGDEWERPVHFQMFGTDRALAVSQLMGARNHGGWSRAAAQKTLRFYARAEYGDSQVDAPLFPTQTDTGFKRFLLRNSGNDWSSVGFRDAMMQSLFRPLARTDTQDYEPAVVYVNGEYWGFQNIREHYSKYYLERRYGVDPDAVDLLKAMVSTEAMEVEEGDDLDYREVLSYVKTNDLSLAHHYAWVESRMDLDNLIDHYACEIYCCNTDWPGNNLGVWRVRTSYNPSARYGHDGRWRWLMYDTDHGFGLSSSVGQDMMFQARRSSRGVCQPHFDRLLANTDFRNRFVNRFADLANSAFKPARVQGIITAMAARYDAEVPRHIARWSRMGDYAGWASRVNGLRTFAGNRPAYALTNIVNEFALGGMARLTLDLTNGAGRITVNSLTIDAATPGLDVPAKPYPWSGNYFKTVPVTVSVTPDPGFAFVRWETPSGPWPDAALTLTVTNALLLRAVLEPAVLPRVTVNEVMAEATKAGGLTHPLTGSAEDWFELLNESPRPVALGGYWLVDSQADNACRIPDGVTLQPGACLRVWTGGSLTLGMNPDGSLNTTFGLGKSGDAVALQTPDRATELDRVSFGSQASNVSQGRWPNGLSGAWVSFTKPTPGLPNRSPAATSGLLPAYAVQAVAAEQTLTLPFAPAAAVSQAVYTVVEGPAGAAVDASGMWSWTPPLTLGSGVYAFRIALMGLLDGAAVTDETTLLVAVSNTQRFLIEGLAVPHTGGAVTGGGAFADGDPVTLTAVPEEGWRFTGWGDGLTSLSRSFVARRDASYTARFAYGLLAPEWASGTVEAGLPLLYWSAVAGAQRYTVSRAASAAGPFVPLATLANNVYVDVAPLAGIDAFYTVTPLREDTEGPVSRVFQAVAGGTVRKLSGTVIGSLLSYNNGGNTREKVFDGDINTFYDALADGGWPGQDYGTEGWRRLAYLRFAPRSNFPGRMVNGRFQVSAVSDGTDTFESPETLYTVTSQPAAGVYTTVPLNLDRRFRYLRYLPPAGGWGNIAELEVYGHDTVPDTPYALAATSGVRSVALAWAGVERAAGYLVWRASASDGPYTAVALATACGYTEGGLPDGTNLFFRVSAVNGHSLSTATVAQAVQTLPPPAAPAFAASAGGMPGLRLAEGRVTLRLSGALDPRLELVCSETLDLPVSQWAPVGGGAVSEPDPADGSVAVSISTDAPRLFFAVRLKAQ